MKKPTEPIEIGPETSLENITLDRREALRRVSGDEELLTELNKIFVSHIQQKLDDLEKAVSENQVRQIIFLAHSIKGATGAIGAKAGESIARNLENAAAEKRSGQFFPLFEQLKREITKLLSILSV